MNIMLKAGDFAHEFTPTFSWAVLIVLLLIPVLAFYIGYAETVRLKVKEVEVKDLKTGKTFTKKHYVVFTANFATRLMYTIVSYIISLIVVIAEHGNGLVQWSMNHAGTSADEFVVALATYTEVGLLLFFYSVFACWIFGVGIKFSLRDCEAFAKGIGATVEEHEKSTMLRVLVRSLMKDRTKKSSTTTTRNMVAKKSSRPAQGAMRVATRQR